MAVTDSSVRFSLALVLRSLPALATLACWSRRKACRPATRSPWARASLRPDAMDFHRGPGLQALLSVDHHLITRGNARCDQRNISLGQIDFDGLQIRLAGLYGVDVRALRPALHRRERHDDRILAHVEHQARIHELIWPQRQI